MQSKNIEKTGLKEAQNEKFNSSSQTAPKVSIITVCYNAEETIADTVSSLDAQSFTDWEHIIIDGASTDNTITLLKQLSSDTRRKIISEADRGVYDAMNKGLSIAKGEVIGFLNADDFFYDAFSLEAIVDGFNHSHKVDFVYGDLCYVQRNNLTKVNRFWSIGPISDDLLAKGAIPPHPTFYIGKRLLKYVNSFSLEYRLASDYHFILRCIRNSNLCWRYINKPLVIMREGGMTSNGVGNVIRQNIEILRIRRELGETGTWLLFLARKFFLKLSQSRV